MGWATSGPLRQHWVLKEVKERDSFGVEEAEEGVHWTEEVEGSNVEEVVEEASHWAAVRWFYPDC